MLFIEMKLVMKLRWLFLLKIILLSSCCQPTLRCSCVDMHPFQRTYPRNPKSICFVYYICLWINIYCKYMIWFSKYLAVYYPYVINEWGRHAYVVKKRLTRKARNDYECWKNPMQFESEWWKNPMWRKHRRF